MNVFNWLTTTFCSVHIIVFASTGLFKNLLCCLEDWKMLCMHSFHMYNMHKYLLH